MATPRLGHITRVAYEEQSSPSPYLSTGETMHGRSRTLGDTDDSSQGGSTPSPGIIGWNNFGSPVSRMERGWTVLKVPLPIADILGHDVPRATLKLGFASVDWGNATFTPQTISVYAARASVDVGDTTWTERDDSANLPWGDVGGKLGVDFDSEPIAEIAISTELYNDIDANAADSQPVFVDLDVTTEVQRAAKLGLSEIVLQFRHDWPYASLVVHADNIRRFVLQNPQSNSNNPHTWLEIEHNAPVSFFVVGPSGEIDYATLLDVALVDRNARIQTGYPAPGSIGPARSAGAGNTSDNDLSNLFLIRSGGWGETPTRTASRRELRHVEVYDTVGSQGYVDGRTRLAPMVGFESTRYQAYLTPVGSSEIGTPLTTLLGNAYGQYDRQETFIHNAKHGFMIEAEWWDDAVAIVGDETWRFEHRADSRPSGYTQQAAERHQMTMFSGAYDAGVADNRAQPDDRWWRTCWDATVQQLARPSYVASVDLSPEGNIPRSHLPVGSVDTRWKVGQSIHVKDSEHAEWAIIRGLIARTDPTNPDTLILDRELGFSYGKDAHATNGLLFGLLKARDRGVIAAAPPSNATGLDLVEAMRAAGTCRILNRLTAATETHSFVLGTGARINFGVGEVVQQSYGIGDLVWRIETESWVPFWMRLVAPESADTEQQLAMVRVIRKQTR